MFTGIVTHIGEVVQVDQAQHLTRFSVAVDLDVGAIDIGASVAHAGTCLTIVETAAGTDGRGILVTEAVKETLDKSTLGTFAIGRKINLELSLKYGDEVGGHLVSGHVDGIAEIVAINPFGGGHTVRFRPPLHLQKFVAEKGSVALDGVSLTVAKLYDDGDFDICVIPHTWAVTTFNKLRVGDGVNFEIDPLARYVARILGHIQSPPKMG